MISLIDPAIIEKAVIRYDSDRYVKKFMTKDYLISMLFCALAKCTSLREVCGAMLGLSDKTRHFQMNCIPRRSTLSDSIQQRIAEVFGYIYNQLLLQNGHLISDSRIRE
ncbi:MAG: DUF4372 domain-containing protein [Candidatus Cloacimonetes bacterium]|jgi:hypothetical protein|nr:DUF4372 domain-containing protein [Candidatus Cloacimonadota bacterium]